MNEKRLVRIDDGRMFAGVCAGLGAYMGIDPTVIRLIFVLLAVFGGGGVLIYLIMWLIMPMADMAQ